MPLLTGCDVFTSNVYLQISKKKKVAGPKLTSAFMVLLRGNWKDGPKI